MLRRNAPAFDAAAREKAAAFLAASTLDRDIELGLAGEAKFARLSWEKLAAQTPEERIEAIQIVGIQNADEFDLDAANRVQRIEAILRDSAQFNAELQFALKAQAQMAEAMFWPDAQFDAWARRFDASHAAEHPLAATTMPVLSGVRATMQSRRIERDMLSVALAVLASGPDQAAQSRDPVTGRPFAYRQTPDGFALQSAFQFKGKPIEMSFDLPK